MSNHKARNTTIVEGKRQYRFALQLTVVQLVVALTFHAATQLRISKKILAAESIETAGALEAVGRDMSLVLLVVGLITCGLVYFLSLWMSNRIVGPLPRMKRAMRSVGNGNYSTRINFRPGDILEGLDEQFNLMVQELQDRHGEPKGETEDEGEEKSEDTSAPTEAPAQV